MDTLSEIENTLDRLIENQNTLNKIRVEGSFVIELSALRKTQESLQAHLFFLGDAYEMIQRSIRARLSEKLRGRIYQKALYYQNISTFAVGPFHRLFQPSNLRIRRRRKVASLVTKSVVQ